MKAYGPVFAILVIRGAGSVSNSSPEAKRDAFEIKTSLRPTLADHTKVDHEAKVAKTKWNADVTAVNRDDLRKSLENLVDMANSEAMNYNQTLQEAQRLHNKLDALVRTTSRSTIGANRVRGRSVAQSVLQANEKAQLSALYEGAQMLSLMQELCGEVTLKSNRAHTALLEAQKACTQDARCTSSQLMESIGRIKRQIVQTDLNRDRIIQDFENADTKIEKLASDKIQEIEDLEAEEQEQSVTTNEPQRPQPSSR